MYELPILAPEEILIYLRKSRSDDPLLTVEEVLAKHEQRLDQWMMRRMPHARTPIPETNRIREVVSGETIDSRPGVQDLFRRIESPKIKAILIIEPQRLSRGDLEDIGRAVKLLRYTNTLVFTEDYAYDLRDTRDREDFERELKRGNDFLEYQKRIMNNGRLLAVQNGNYLGNKPPYGFRKIDYKEGKRVCHTLEPIPEEAAIVKLIFEMYRDGKGTHTIARHLNELGVKTQKGGRWAAESIVKMRKNQHYIGNVVWNHRQTVKSVENGEIVVSRPMSKDFYVFPGKHPAIIDQELWDAVQEIRDKIPPVKDKAKCVNPFAGIVYCRCGFSMTHRVYKNKGVERSGRRLLCTNQVECRTASCLVSEMEEEVIRILKEAIEDFELQIKNNSSDRMELHRQLVAQKEKRLEELDALEIAQWDKYTQEGMPKHIFDTLNAKVLAEKEEVQQALCLLKDTLPEPVNYEQKKALFSEALDKLLDPDVPALEKNLLLKRCIDKIEYNREKKKNDNRRYGTPEPMELDVYLRV